MFDLKYHLVTYYFLGHQFVPLVRLDAESLVLSFMSATYRL